MSNFLNICFRTILVLIILFFITKMMGKKQISELNFFDYIVGITIGSIAADISLDIEKNMIAGIAALFIYGFISYIISFVSIKSILARRFFIGVPTVLVEKGKIIESGLKKSKIDVNDLLMVARENGYFNLDEIDYALMEVNGNISFLPKEKEKPVTKKDIKIKCSNEGLTVNAIIDSKYMANNMKAINKDKEWLDHELKVNGYDNYDNILLATIDNNYKVTIYEKNVKPDKNTVLEQYFFYSDDIMKSDMEVDNMKFKKIIIISIVISVILLICSLLLPNINIDKDTIGYNGNDTYNIKSL